MRKLQPNETAQAGDWFYYFGPGEWIRLDASPKPFFRMTIQEADDENKAPHFPIVIMRPNPFERILGTMPKEKPNQHKIRKNRR